jgi:hypothetical protein
MADATPKQAYWVSVIITVAALALAAVHIIVPNANIDAITLTLLVIAVVPWLAPILKTVELPGGWKFEFRELKEKVEQELRDNSRQVRAVAQRVEQLAQFAIRGAGPTSLKDQLAGDLSRFREYLISLGVDLTGDPPGVEVGDATYENAHYDGRKNEIVAGLHFASSDVLYREYTHYVLGRVRGQTGLIAGQQDAVESALADYFPCSYRDDPQLGREIAAYLRSRGGFNKPAIRDLETTAKMSDVADRRISQASGEIWAAAFWDIRKLLGMDATDRLLLQAWKDASSGGKAETDFITHIKQLAPESKRAAVADAFARRELP